MEPNGASIPPVKLERCAVAACNEAVLKCADGAKNHKIPTLQGEMGRGTQTDKPETDTDGVPGCKYRIADCMYLFFSCLFSSCCLLTRSGLLWYALCLCLCVRPPEHV